MFKNFKIRRLQREIRDDQEMLRHMVNQTEEIKHRVFDEILTTKSYDNLEWSAALREQSVQEELFQFLLHRQFIGYLAENVRQKTCTLLMLQGQASFGFLFNKQNYRKLIEKETSESEMKTLFDQFTNEMRLLLEVAEKASGGDVPFVVERMK